jgi:hypothetical protein
MKSRLTQTVGLLLLTGTLLGIGAPIVTAQDWRRERWEERLEQRRAERLERAFIRGIFGAVRERDRDRRVRYHYRGGRQYVGYYDRWGDFHAVGFYDRFGNFWRYR